jgi:hypothetical protein
MDGPSPRRARAGIGHGARRGGDRARRLVSSVFPSGSSPLPSGVV